ncbi:MAG: MATE family efflux transporter [Cyanobacteria bacterium P01_F01_bin.150]
MPLSRQSTAPRPSTVSRYSSWRQEVIASAGLAFPLAFAQVAQATTGFIDTLMTGMLGSDALAAAGLGAMLFMFLSFLGINLVGSVSPLVAEAYGAKRFQDIGPITEQGIWLALIVSIPITLFLLDAEPFLRLLGQKNTVIDLTGPYLRAIALGYFPAALFAVLRNFVSALSRPRSVLMIMAIAVAVNTGANYVLMFGKWGFPMLGVAGTGWASTFTYWVMALSLLVYVLWQKDFHPYQIGRTLYRFRWRQFRAIAVLGIPMGCSSLCEGGLFSAATVLAGQLGVTVLAAHQIALQTAALTFMVPLGIAQATTVRVGQYVGQKNPSGAKMAGYAGISLGIGFMGVMGVAFLTVPRLIIGAYLDISAPENQAVVTMAVSLLAVGGMFQLADGIQVIAVGALRGLQDTAIPMVIGIIAYWGIGFSVSYLAAFYWQLGGVGLWWGLAIGLAIAAVSFTYRFHALCKRFRVSTTLGG